MIGKVRLRNSVNHNKVEMLLIFLDIDGVMNSTQAGYWYRKMLGHEVNDWVNYRAEDTEEFSSHHKQLCPLACGNLRRILEYYPEARIVISSTWRKGKSRTVDWFNRLFKLFKIFEEDKVIGKTPVLHTERGYEIQDWLNKFNEPVEDFVILDDDGDMGPYRGTHRFVQTQGEVGFDYFAMEKVDKIFGKFTLKFADLKPNVFYKMYSKLREGRYFKDGEGMSYYDHDGNLHKHVHMYEPSELFSEV